MTQRIGFIGLGIMGQAMAANILKQGYPLSTTARRERRMSCARPGQILPIRLHNLPLPRPRIQPIKRFLTPFSPIEGGRRLQCDVHHIELNAEA